jgi:hypothetical protein
MKYVHKKFKMHKKKAMDVYLVIFVYIFTENFSHKGTEANLIPY